MNINVCFTGCSYENFKHPLREFYTFDQNPVNKNGNYYRGNFENYFNERPYKMQYFHETKFKSAKLFWENKGCLLVVLVKIGIYIHSYLFIMKDRI